MIHTNRPRTVYETRHEMTMNRPGTGYEPASNLPFKMPTHLPFEMLIALNSTLLYFYSRYGKKRR